MPDLLSFRLPILLFTFLTVSCSKDEEAKEDWYDVSEINDQTWIFEEPKSSQVNVSYLIAGSERAIMLDAGTGENKGQGESKIMYKIQETTNLPVTLLLSHFHFDHNQNIGEFESVGFPELTFLKEAVDDNGVYKFSGEDLFFGSRPAETKVNEWFPLETDIDLGGRKVQIFNLPGHTDESVVIIDHVNKLAFMGDFLYNGALFVFDAQDLATYILSIEKLITVIDQDYNLYGAHGEPKVSYTQLINSKNLLECITNSDCYSKSNATVFGSEATVYQSLDKTTVVFLIHTN